MFHAERSRLKSRNEKEQNNRFFVAKLDFAFRQNLLSPLFGAVYIAAVRVVN